MDPLPLSTIAQFASGELNGESARLIERVSTDSRTITQGDLFVALRGENFDAHKFIAQVAEAGAAAAIIDRDWTATPPRGLAVIRVHDTLAAYQQLAANYRKSLRLKVVGITGSNGKTSTKDFAASILARRFRVTKTEGNFNNHVGVPRTILEATSADEMAVWEIGMNHRGETAALAKLVAPDAAIITNVGVAHIEYMGSREAIAQEKGDLAVAVPANGFVILNADDPFSERIAARSKARVMFAGIQNGTIRASEIEQTADGAEFTISERAHRARVQLPVPGLHMVQNALLATAVGRVFAMTLEECAAGLHAAPLTQARLQMREVNGVQFIDDSYNANPDSMKAALRTLAELDVDGKRIAVLGQMGELGAESERGHREVGETAAELSIDELITTDATSAAIATAARRAGLVKSTAAKDTSEAARLLSAAASPGDLVLVKGSRSARTERVIEEFSKHRTAELASR